MRRYLGMLSLVPLVMPAAAQAQGAAGEPVPEPPAPTGATAPTGSELVGAGEDPEDVRFVDTNLDRVLITATGETHPAGTFWFSDYDLFLLQFGYAFTDHLEASIAGLPPIIEGQPYFFDVTLKLNVLRSADFRAAIEGGLDLAVAANGDVLAGGRLGAVGTFCFTPTCQTSLSAGFGTAAHNQMGSFMPLWAHLGLVGRISEVFAVLLEPIFFADLAEGGGRLAEAMLLGYGVRLSGPRWGLDVGFIKLVPFAEGHSDPLIVGFPVARFTYRTEWEPRSGPSLTVP